LNRLIQRRTVAGLQSSSGLVLRSHERSKDLRTLSWLSATQGKPGNCDQPHFTRQWCEHAAKHGG